MVEEDAVMKANQTYADEYREIAARFTRLVEGVPDPNMWDNPAPPEGWVARDVVRHLVDWFPSFLEDGAGIVLRSGPGVDADPVGAWRTFSDGVQAVLDDPAMQERRFSHRHTGGLPLPVAISRFFTSDVFMHTWDLARATGQDETLDPERCAVMLEGMEPLEELIRSSGEYGARVPVSEDASPQEKLLAFIGRDTRHGNA